jgi:hypothetical protein
MIETARLRELAASYRSEVKAPSATAALARYREEFAQYLESVADALDSAQLDTRTALRLPTRIPISNLLLFTASGLSPSSAPKCLKATRLRYRPRYPAKSA